jgi:hypothetical protein
MALHRDSRRALAPTSGDPASRGQGRPGISTTAFRPFRRNRSTVEGCFGYVDSPAAVFVQFGDSLVNPLPFEGATPCVITSLFSPRFQF